MKCVELLKLRSKVSRYDHTFISSVMMVGKYNVEWLKKVVEKMVFMVEDQAFTESSRDRNKSFLAYLVRESLIELVAIWS